MRQKYGNITLRGEACMVFEVDSAGLGLTTLYKVTEKDKKHH